MVKTFKKLYGKNRICRSVKRFFVCQIIYLYVSVYVRWLVVVFFLRIFLCWLLEYGWLFPSGGGDVLCRSQFTYIVWGSDIKNWLTFNVLCIKSYFFPSNSFSLFAFLLPFCFDFNASPFAISLFHSFRCFEHESSPEMNKQT